MFDFFLKKIKREKENDTDKSSVSKQGFLQRLAMKKLEKMNPQERQKLMQKVLNPENISKNKDGILSAMEQMKASGQITEEQIELAKKRLGI